MFTPFDYQMHFQHLKKSIFEANQLEKSDIVKISLTVSLPQAGWMASTLQIGYDSYNFDFSDTYPPFQKIKKWIENIIDDQDSEPVMIDDEHNEHFFYTTKTTNPDRLIFEYLRFTYPGTGVYRKALIGKQQLVETFYLVFEYLMSIDFEKEEQIREGGIEYPLTWFHLDPNSDDIIRFDLSKMTDYLKINNKTVQDK